MFSQNNPVHECGIIEKNNAHNTDNFDYRSKKKVILKPGFSYSSDNSKKFRGSIDPLVICELDGNNKINEYNSQNPYIHDNTLTVGSTAGVAGVSPTGAATYEIPLFVSPGTAGMQPSLSIVYNSQSGNGILGMGWNFTGLSAISLSPNLYYNDGYFEAIKFNDQLTSTKDRYRLKYTLDGNRLVCVNGNYGQANSEYRTELESFSKIIYENDKFVVYGKNGIKTYYGSSNNSVLKLKSGSYRRTFTWYIDKIEDTNGNYILYEYYDDRDDEKLIKRISYTGNTGAGLSPYNSIEFVYGERQDRSMSYVAGTDFRQTVVVEKILIKHQKEIIKQYIFKYNVQGSASEILSTKLIKIEECDGKGDKLNPIVIEWGEKARGSGHEWICDTPDITSYLNSLYGSGGYKIDTMIHTPLTGDFNGDGLQDFAYAYNVFYTLGERHRKSYFEIKVFLSNCDGTFEETGSLTSLNENYQVYVCDFDLSGKQGFYAVNLTENSPGYRKTKKFMLNYFNSHLVDYGEIETNSLGKIYASGNFSGNGKPSILAYRKLDLLNEDMLLQYFETDNITGNNTLINKSIAYPSDYMIMAGGPILSITTHNSSNLTLDFDGDGVSEIICFYNDSPGEADKTGIFEFNNITNSFQKLYDIPTDIINKDTPIEELKLADFNGDGKTDLMKYIGNNTWQIYFSDGITFKETSTITFLNYFKNVYTIDINGDGKIDILSFLDIYCSNGDGTFTLIHSDPGSPYTNMPLVFGDFNGDGVTDIICREGNSGYLALFFRAGDKSNLVKKITNGFTIESSFSYTTIAKFHCNYDYGDEYMREKNGIYDVIPFISPLNVVETFTQGNSTNKYEFIKGLINVTGKGFLGFEEVTVKNTVQNKFTKTNTIIDKKFCFASSAITSIKLIDYYAPNQYEVSYHETNMIRRPMSVTNPNHVSILPKTVIEKNYLEGLDRTTEYRYNNESSGDFYGNLDNITISQSEVVNKTDYSNYITNGSWCRSKPQNITEYRIYAGNEFGNTLTNEYDNKGRLTKTISDSYPNLGGKPLTQIYTYDVYGNILSSTLSGRHSFSSETQTRVSRSEYDNKGRFATKLTDIAGTSEEYEYEPYFGNINRLKDALGNNTTYKYDSFGNLKELISPLGHSTIIERKWENNVRNDLAYRVKTVSPGNPTSIVWYDIYGREVKTQSELYGNEILTEKQYYADGLLQKESLPYYSNGTGNKKWKEYEYDEFKRLSLEKCLGLETAYGYTHSTNLLHTSCTTPDGNRKTNMYANGELRSTSSNNGTISYKYHPCGQVNEVTVGGVVLSRMEYDKYGNQTALIDADAGHTYYEYNAFGELIMQSDANGIKFNLNYDNAGRLISKKCINDDQYSVYYEYISSGKHKGLLDMEYSRGYMEAKYYIYDDYGNIIQILEYIDGNPVSRTYTYDPYNNLETMDYGTGFGIRNEYDKSGSLTAVYNNRDNSVIWKVSGSYPVNEMGQILTYRSGPNSIVTTYDYDGHYQLTGIHAGTVFSYTYSFDHYTGNLKHRVDNKSGYRESFHYDNNRLINWDIYSGPDLVSSTGMKYNNRGNIIDKIGVGGYEYEARQPHAVSSIISGYYDTSISTLTQEITYDPLQRVRNIREGDYRYEIIYGSDSQRKKSFFYENDNLIKTKTYRGLLEIEEDGNNNYTRNIHYIPTGDGITAVHITDSRNNGGDTYYLVKDYLGSVMMLINEHEETIESHNYDPWGNLRNPIDFTFNDVNTDFIVNRGFTGHEYLPEFGLVNMNGRMYDPVISRMLSPDNFVQDPTNFDNYNRYSYCLNNPLKYTDPSGEFWHLIIGGIIGGTTNVLFNLKNIDNFWQGLGYFGIGAGAGALAAGIGSGVGVALQGGSFSAGFLGTSTTVTGVGFLGGASAGLTNGFITGTGNSLMQGNKFGESLVNGLISGGKQALIGGAIAGTSALIRGKNFFTGDVTFKDKLAFMLENNESALRAEFGDQLVDEIKVQKKVFLSNPGKTYTLKSDLTGLDFNGYNGFRSRIALSPQTLNAYFRSQDKRAVSVLFHEFFHAQDMYSGLDAFVTNTLSADKAYDLFEVYTYERTYRMFGTQIGPNQISDWKDYWIQLLKF